MDPHSWRSLSAWGLVFGWIIVALCFSFSGCGGVSPAITFSLPSIKFGSQHVGTTSSPQVTTLTNTGTGVLTITSIGITGTNSGDFVQTNNCPSSLAPNDSCTLSVTFSPAATGTRNAAVSVAYNAPGSPQSAPLTGIGMPPAVTFSLPSINFGNQGVGMTSSPQVTTLTNTGTGVLTITSIGITGTNSGDFAQTNNCPSSLAPNGSCTLSVTFSPAATGTRNAAVSVADDAPGSPQSVPLTGAGTTWPGVPLHGVVQSGQQPVSGSTIQLYVAGSSGYGSAALSLLTNSLTSDASGNFSTGNYTCPSASAQVYLVASGGNPGLSAGTNNSALALMSALGPCGNLSASTSETINEVTTVASVWALAQFLSTGAGANLGTSDTNAQGLANAFATVNNLVNISSGYAPGPNLPPGATAPTSGLYTLADILWSCASSNGTTGQCSSLFAAATPSGGSAPTNTIDAALDIAQNPGNNVSTLYNLVTGTAPFQPVLTSAPTDWTVVISYYIATGVGWVGGNVAVDALGNVWVESPTSEFSSSGQLIKSVTGGGLNGAAGLAIDDVGNLWVSNGGNDLSEFSSEGSPISPSTGYTGGGLFCPMGLAVDPSGNVWAANYCTGATGISEFSSDGTPISPSTGYTGGGFAPSKSLFVDSSNNIWVSDSSGGGSISEFSSDGTPISPSTGYTGGGLNYPDYVVVDGFGNVWAANDNTWVGNYPPWYEPSLSKFSNTGSPISPSAGGYTGGGLVSRPFGMIVDGSGNIWIANAYLSEFSSDGVPLSPSTGYGAQVREPFYGIAIDGSGNMWTTYTAPDYSGWLAEFVGVAAPVVTPLATAVKNNQLGQRP